MKYGILQVTKRVKKSMSDMKEKTQELLFLGFHLGQ